MSKLHTTKVEHRDRIARRYMDAGLSAKEAYELADRRVHEGSVDVAESKKLRGK